MANKVLVIISTAEKEKAKIGIMYATNALKKEWLEDVKVFFFGPFEKLIAEDKELQLQVEGLIQYSTPSVCKLISDNEGISDNLSSLGYELDYIGSTISNYIKDGYIPMVF